MLLPIDYQTVLCRHLGFSLLFRLRRLFSPLANNAGLEIVRRQAALGHQCFDLGDLGLLGRFGPGFFLFLYAGQDVVKVVDEFWTCSRVMPFTAARVFIFDFARGVSSADVIEIPLL